MASAPAYQTMNLLNILINGLEDLAARLTHPKDGERREAFISMTPLALYKDGPEAVAAVKHAASEGTWSSVKNASLAMAVAGFTATSWNVVTVSLRQQIVPQRLFGRVNAAYRLFGLGMMPIGGVVGGLIAHRYGLHMPFLILGGVIVAETIPIGLIATDKAIAEARNSRPIEPVETDELVTD